MGRGLKPQPQSLYYEGLRLRDWEWRVPQQQDVADHVREEGLLSKSEVFPLLWSNNPVVSGIYIICPDIRV